MTIDLEDLKRKAEDVLHSPCKFMTIEPATILALIAEIKQARRKALHEAMIICAQREEDAKWGSEFEFEARACAEAIRALLDKEDV